MIKHVIFDFDGTIVDSLEVFLSSWNTIAEEHKLKKIQPHELEILKKLSLKQRIKRLDFPMYKFPIIAPKIYNLYQASMHKLKLFDGMREVLLELSERGYKTSIISSNDRDNIISFLDYHNLTSINSVLCSSSIFGKDKLLKKYLRENNVKPSEVIYVGDEQRDIIACKKTGVKIIWVGWGYDSLKVVEKEKPDFQVYEPREIVHII